MRTRISVAALLALLCATSAQAADPLASLSYLVGTWNCSYNSGSQHVNYQATYAFVMGKSWLRETDAWGGGGGSDIGLTTYEPKTGTWTEIVAENERSTTIFRAKGSDAGHRVYQSVYPDGSFNLVFDRVSDTEYTLHAHGKYAGTMMTSHDTCTKQT